MKADIRSFVVDQLLSGKAVEDQEDLLVSGLVDSIGVMRLVAYLEQQNDMQIPPQDVTIENFTSIDAITRYIAERQVP